MAAEVTLGPEVVLETDRLLLRPWRVAEAVVQHELWVERDPRVPPRRRIDSAGHPTVAELEEAIRASRSSSVGLLAVERKAAGDVIGYCGLIEGERGIEGEPELAFELLRRTCGRGYATEAATAVLDWARSCRYVRLWATVWEWNAASRRVLDKLGFTEAGREQVDGAPWTSLLNLPVNRQAASARSVTRRLRDRPAACECVRCRLEFVRWFSARRRTRRSRFRAMRGNGR